MTKELSKEELLTALRVHKGLPAYYDEKDLAQAKIKLTRRPTIGEVFDIVDLLTYPANKNSQELRKDLSIANIVIDKIGATEEQWKDATEEFEKENKENIEKAKQKLKDLAQEEQSKSEDSGDTDAGK